MRKAKKSKPKKEPAIIDVMGAVQNLSGTVQKLSGRFDTLSETVQDLTEAVQEGFERHEGILKTLVEGQEHLREKVSILDQRVSKTQNRVEDIADSLGDITRVADRDRVSTIDHERRIRHLERARA